MTIDSDIDPETGLTTRETSSHPFARLTPERILDALDSAGFRGDGRLLALNSYENRVYLAGIEDSVPVVAKFYRAERWSDAQILEEHAFVADLAEREIPVVPALASDDGATLHHHEDLRFAVFPKRGGRAPELEDRATRLWMGRFIGRIHGVGAIAAYTHRPALNLETFGIEPRSWIAANHIVPAPLDEVWAGVVDSALEGVRRCEERAGASVRTSLIRLHGDCHAGNVLWTQEDANSDTEPGPHFVDFDDSRMGPALQDLWMLLSGSREDMTRQLADVLAGYEQFCDFDRRELARLEGLRTLRMIHYSAWIARRWDDPAFPAAFPWFGSAHYWQNQILALREQIAAMDEPALDP